MTEIRIKVSNNLFRKLPESHEEIQELLRLGLEIFNTRRRKPGRNIVDKTFAALPIKDHRLIEQVIEQVKYGV